MNPQTHTNAAINGCGGAAMIVMLAIAKRSGVVLQPEEAAAYLSLLGVALTYTAPVVRWLFVKEGIPLPAEAAPVVAPVAVQ